MYISQFRVTYADIDKMGVMYHGNYARYLEIARVEYIRTTGISYLEIEQRGVMLPLIQWNIQFLRPIVYDDTITIQTIAREILPEQQILFLSELYNDKNKIMAKATVTLCYIDAITKRAIKAPNWLQEKIEKIFE